jgi:hypothetical protein
MQAPAIFHLPKLDGRLDGRPGLAESKAGWTPAPQFKQRARMNVSFNEPGVMLSMIIDISAGFSTVICLSTAEAQQSAS